MLFIYRDTFQSLSYTIPAATTVSIGQKRSNQHHSQLVQVTSTSSKRIVLSDDRLSWPALLRADNKELGRMVAGLNNTVASSEQYFSRGVLKAAANLSQGIGLPDPSLAACLLATWIFIFISLAKGVQSSGKLAYFNALFPYGKNLYFLKYMFVV